MKKTSYNGGNKELEKLKQENKKIKEEYEKYKESTIEKLKELENLTSQNEKLKKENEELKKKLTKNGGTVTTQNSSSKNVDKLKNDLRNKEATISLINKQKDFLISILTRITNLNIKNKISKEIILSQLDEKNIDKEKEKEKLTSDIISTIQEGKKLNMNNINNYNNLIKNNFSFEILTKKNSKIISGKNSRGSNNSYNDKNNCKKEAELIRKLNEVLAIIKKRKEILKSKKNNLSFRVGTIKEGK